MVANIHLQVNLSQTQEVARLQHSSVYQAIAHQESISTKMEMQTKNEETEVQITGRTEERNVGRRTLLWKKRRKKELNKEEIKITMGQDPIRGRIIDVFR